MRVRLRSIQGRMLALSAIATLVALAIAATLIAGVLARVVTGGIDQRLDAQLALLASTVSPSGLDAARLALLRGALDAGRGWRWRVDAPGGGVGSDDLPVPRERIGPPPPDGPGPRDDHSTHDPESNGRPRPFDGDDRSGATLHARQLRIMTDTGVVTLTAAAPRDVIRRPVLGALTPLLVTLSLLGMVLAVAAVVQIRLGLRPVHRLRADVGRVRAGQADAVDENQPDELRPLAQELNALLHDNDAALATARASASNLAHALKTPVATLALELRGDPRAALVDRIDATIRHHLARARTSLGSRRVSTRLAPAIGDLAATIVHLAGDRAVPVDVSVADDLFVAVDPADLDELVGNLIDNAVRHAASRVVIQAATNPRGVTVSIIDDGPGIPAAARLRATEAGVRLDERGDGHGFGLSIVRDLVELHGGTLALDEASGGGLRASLTLPMVTGATR